MVKIGDIFYFKVGGDPIIICEEVGNMYKGRYVIQGELIHGYYILTEQDIKYYFKR